MAKKVFTMIVFFAFIAKVSAQIEVHSSNQVGIGTANPQYKLHVVGDAYVTGNIIANNMLSGFTGSSSNSNVSFGYEALLNSVANTNNTAVGYQALRTSNHTEGRNTAFGSYAIYANTAGNYNTAIGGYALTANTSGDKNTAIGDAALYLNTTGRYNTATGWQALLSNKTGGSNTANGDHALYSNTSSNNTAMGKDALYNNTTGSYNTAIGVYALRSTVKGKYNTAIGYGASDNANNLNNSTAIGYGAQATASNQVRIGNNAVTSIGGYVAWSNISDGRAKKNIQRDVPGLAFINSLQPVTYNLDLDAMDELMKIEKPMVSDVDSVAPSLSQELADLERKAREFKEKQVQTGFVAQDVEKAAKDAGYDFSGVDVDEMGIYSLRYAEFVVPLVKAVQELSEQNDRLQEQINELNKRIEILERK